LTAQPQNHRYYVVYSASGTNIAAALVDTKNTPNIEIGEARISPTGFVVDYTTFWFSTNNPEEAYYIVTVLNSSVLDQMIKDRQPKGKLGPRHITRLPFEFDVPEYDPNNRLHKQIASLGVKATNEASGLPKMSRLKIKAAIPSMKEIDKLVSELMGSISAWVKTT
jgi:hypothetical protein